MWQGASSSKRMGIITYICARRLIKRGCESYLTYIHVVSIESLSLDSIPRVLEFFYILPIDLPSLPLKHSIEFVIDFELGTRPIAMASYYMATIEFKEVNYLLQDLLGKVSLALVSLLGELLCCI